MCVYKKNRPLENIVPTHLRTLLMAITTTLILTACGNGNGDSDSFHLPGCADTGTCASNPALTIGGDRPAMVMLPADYDNSTRYPLVVLLHGRGADGRIQALYMDMFERVDRLQFILAYPDGLELGGRKQWRSTPTCCDTPLEEAEAVSDVGYISRLIEEAAATYSIDTTRIGLVGHSSGGFMALTMACEASHLFTSLVNLAGATFEDLEQCQPAAEAVSVLTVHGDLDDTVFYDGLEGVYLSAPAVADRYAWLADCDMDDPLSLPDVDLIGNVDGAESSVVAWQDCAEDTEVQFWTMNGGPHIPAPWIVDGLDQFITWVLEHPRD